MMMQRKALARRKEMLLAQAHLERLQMGLAAEELRLAARPGRLAAGLFVGRSTSTTLANALVNAAGPLLGLRRSGSWMRLGSLAMVAYKMLPLLRKRR